MLRCGRWCNVAHRVGRVASASTTNTSKSTPRDSGLRGRSPVGATPDFFKNDAEWRKAVFALYGSRCRLRGVGTEVGLCRGRLHCHHIRYKSQGGASVLGNGIPVCDFHHSMVHARRILIPKYVLEQVTLDHLRISGWVDWDGDGIPFGRGFRGFASE